MKFDLHYYSESVEMCYIIYANLQKYNVINVEINKPSKSSFSKDAFHTYTQTSFLFLLFFSFIMGYLNANLFCRRLQEV